METVSHLSSDGERIPELGESDVLVTVEAPGTSAVSDTNGGSLIDLDTSYLTDVKDTHLEEKSCASAFEEVEVLFLVESLLPVCNFLRS